MESKPWECPHCHTVYAPFVQSCRCQVPNANIQPPQPKPWFPTTPFGQTVCLDNTAATVYRHVHVEQPKNTRWPPRTMACKCTRGHSGPCPPQWQAPHDPEGNYNGWRVFR